MSFVEVPSAQGDITVVAADLGLPAVRDRGAVTVDAQVHGRLASAFADRLDLDQRVGEREQACGAFEQRADEIGAQAVGEHRDADRVGEMRELADLFGGKELRLVDQHARERRLRVLGQDESGDIGRRIERGRRRLQPDPGGDRARREARVDRGGEQHRPHAALAIVEVGLQQRGRLACVHAGVVEVELGHQSRR